MSTEFNDKELFEGAIAEEAAAKPAEADQNGSQEQTQPQDAGQPRDEHGRFAAQQQDQQEEAEQTQDQAQTEPEGKVEGKVPSSRLREEAEARRKVEAELAELRQTVARLQQAPQPHPQAHQPPQEEPDLVSAFFENPAAMLAQRDTQMLGAVGEALAKATPEGAKSYDEAFQALATLKQQNPAAFAPAYASIMNNHPLHQARALVDWHKAQQVQQRVGSDPEAFFSRTLEERLTSDPAFAASLVEKLTGQARQQPQGQQSKPLLNLPPSLSRATSAAPAVGSLGDVSDTALFNDALR